MDSRILLPAGTVLDGSYRIVRVVGSGGFGVTYEAEDTKLGMVVAIKEYYPFDFADRDASLNVVARSERHQRTFDWGRDGFLREARTLARFEHPAIVRVARVFEAHSTAYMVMRFEAGRSLEEWLVDLGRPPTQEELDAICSRLLDALGLLHKAEFLHRDIAPDNIIIRPDGTPVLLDFGAARRAMAEMSRSPAGIVKAGYSPHEQYSLDTRLQGPWSDIYALGATLYRAVAGRPPEEATLRIEADRMPPAREVGKRRYRQGFLDAIDACLAVNYFERPQSVAQLRQMLLATGKDPAGTDPAAVQDRRRSNWLRPLTAASLVLLALGTGYGALDFGHWGPATSSRNVEETNQVLASPQGQRELELERQRREADERQRQTEAVERRVEIEAEQRRQDALAAAAQAEVKRLAEHAALVRSLQAALSHVGCYTDEIDGQWDAKTRAAFERFAKHTKKDLASGEPTMAALYDVVSHKDHVCPLKCGEGTVQRGGTCVAKPKAAPPAAAGERPPRVTAAPDYDPHDRSRRVTPGGYVTCGRNGCQRVPPGCHAVRGAGGGGLGGKIFCP